MVHGMLTVGGEKLSKSKGTFINARTYLDFLSPDYLRYYFACKLTDSSADLDLSWDDFLSRVNSDLVGKITNLASRGVQMLAKHFDSELGSFDEEGKKLLLKTQNAHETIASYYEKRQFAKAMLLIRELVDDANKYFDAYEPWKLVKEDKEAVHKILTSIIHIFRCLTIYLSPVLPSYSQKVRQMLCEEKDYSWKDLFTSLEKQKIKAYTHLLKRADKKAIEKITEKSKEEQKMRQDEKVSNETEKKDKTITIDDFLKVDLRLAKIIEASEIAEAKKLLKLDLDLGELGSRTVFAGIKSAYKAEDLKDKFCVVVANLKPRKMKFGTSEGMVLAAGPGGEDIWLISPDLGAKPGMRVS